MAYTYILLIILTISFSIYIIKDGFTLAICCILPWANNNQQKLIYNYLLPSWDANQTWLVFTMAALYGAFSSFFGLVLSRLYIPFIAMLLLFIIRGASIEFSLKDKKYRQYWTYVLALSSFLILAIQTLVVLYLILNQQNSAYHFDFSASTTYIYYPLAFLTVISYHFLKAFEFLALTQSKHKLLYLLLLFNTFLALTGLLFDRLTIGYFKMYDWHYAIYSLLMIMPVIIFRISKYYFIRIYCHIILSTTLLAIIFYLFPYYNYITQQSLLSLSSTNISIKIICVASTVMLPILALSIHFLHKIFEQSTESLVY